MLESLISQHQNTKRRANALNGRWRRERDRYLFHNHLDKTREELKYVLIPDHPVDYLETLLDRPDDELRETLSAPDFIKVLHLRSKRAGERASSLLKAIRLAQREPHSVLNP